VSLRGGLSAAVLLALCAAAAAVFSHGPAGTQGQDTTQVEVPVGALGDSNLYFVHTRVAWHHNPWECDDEDECLWPRDEARLGIVHPAAGRLPGWPGWRPVSYVTPLLSDGPYPSGSTVVTLCRLCDGGGAGLDCGHGGAAISDAGWRFEGNDPHRPLSRWIHDNEQHVIAAVCLDEDALREAKEALDESGGYIPLRAPRRAGEAGVKGWTSNYDAVTAEMRSVFGRGWTAADGDGHFAEPARIAALDHDDAELLGLLPTAAWRMSDDGDSFAVSDRFADGTVSRVLAARRPRQPSRHLRRRLVHADDP